MTNKYVDNVILGNFDGATVQFLYQNSDPGSIIHNVIRLSFDSLTAEAIQEGSWWQFEKHEEELK